MKKLIFNKVLILSQYYKPESGAPQIRLAKMAEQLKKNGCDVRVLTAYPNYPTGKIYDGYKRASRMEEEIDGINVTRSWIYPASGRSKLKRLINYLSFTISSTPKLLFFKWRPDVVFVEAQPITLAFPAYLNLKFKKIPYIYNTPDLQIEYAEQDKWLPLAFMIFFAKKIEKFFMKNAFSVTTVTHEFIRHFSKERKINYEKFSFLPNGADTKKLYPINPDEDFKKKMGVTNQFIITYAGTHAPYQGLELIINTAKRLKNRKDIIFLLAGDGPERKKLIELSKSYGLNNVIFQHSPFSEMHKLMSITYASLVVLRAMPISKKMRLSKTIPPLACGVPVIYSGWGESAKIISDFKCGLVVDPENSLKLANEIKGIIDNQELRNKMSLSARKTAELEFDWNVIISNWIENINDIYDKKLPRIKGMIEFNQ